MSNLEQLKYPIGKFTCPATITEAHIKDWTQVLEQFPNRLEALVSLLSDEQLNTPYRPDGWTVRQVVHHVSDSHHHSYTRIKWALTEDQPTIKAYYEDRWAKVFDYGSDIPIQPSLRYLSALHAKLVFLIKGLSDEDLRRTYIHPDGNRIVSLKEHIGTYAWHSNHHYAHVKNLVDRMNW